MLGLFASRANHHKETCSPSMSAPNSQQEEGGPAVIRLVLGPPPDRLLLERLAGDAVSDLVALARMQLNGGAETGITERIGSS